MDPLNVETCLVRLSTTRRSVAKIARERTEGMRVDSVVSHKLPDPETRLIVTPLVRPRFFFSGLASPSSRLLIYSFIPIYLLTLTCYFRHIFYEGMYVSFPPEFFFFSADGE